MLETIDNLDLENVLLTFHLYLLATNVESENLIVQNGVKAVQGILSEIVQLLKLAIMNPYKAVKNHDKKDIYLVKWIILYSMGRGVQEPEAIQPQD